MVVGSLGLTIGRAAIGHKLVWISNMSPRRPSQLEDNFILWKL